MTKRDKLVALKGSIINPKVAEELADLMDSLDGAQAAEAVANIATPASATAEQVALKVNELLASLRAAKLLK